LRSLPGAAKRRGEIDVLHFGRAAPEIFSARAPPRRPCLDRCLPRRLAVLAGALFNCEVARSSLSSLTHRVIAHPDLICDGAVPVSAKGVKFGSKPKLSDYQRQEALKRRAAGETLTEIARSYAVDVSMISRLS
jgi:hypothetical protein